jgi:hypothetical protein
MSILHIYRQHRQKRKTLTIRNPLCFSFVFCFCFCFFLWGWGDFYERLWYGPLVPILDTKVTWWLMSMQAAALCWVSQMFQGFSFQTNNIYPQSNLAFSSTVILILPEHLSKSPVFSEFHIARSLVFNVMFVDHCLSLFLRSLSFVWLPLWYLVAIVLPVLRLITPLVSSNVSYDHSTAEGQIWLWIDVISLKRESLD